MQGELNTTLAMIRARECRTVDDGPFKSIGVDGDFGPNTEASIRRIQEYINQHNLATPALVVDGVFGPNTLRAMRALVAAGPSSLVGPIYSPTGEQTPEPRGDDLTIRVSDIVRPQDMDATYARCLQRVPGLTREGFETAIENSVSRINSLAPEMRAATMFGIRELYAGGYAVTVGDEGGMRGRAAQNRAHASGYSQVRYGDSYHNHGFALDVVMATASGEPDDYFPAGQVRAIRSAMTDQGLHTITGPSGWDPMHFQFAPARVGARAFASGATRDAAGLITDVADNRENADANAATARLLAERNPQPPVQTRPTAPRHVEPDEELPRPVQLIAAVFSGDRDRAGEIFRSIFA